MTRLHQFTTNTVTIQGVPIYYELYNMDAYPEKPALFLIHGFLSSTFSYRRLVPFLAPEYPVVALDLPPFGRSGKSNRFVYSYQNFASVVLNLADYLQLKKIILIGHSMGGQVALRASLLDHETVDKTVLLGSSGYLAPEKKLIAYSSYLPFFHLYLKKWFEKRGVEQNLLNVIHDRAMIDQEMIDGYLEPFLQHDIFRALTRMIRHREGDLSKEELGQVKAPSLLLWGKQDKVMPYSIGKRLAEDLPAAKLVGYDKTGHLVPEERPDYIHRDFSSFISDGINE